MYLESNISTLKVPSRNINLRLAIKFRCIIVIFSIVPSHMRIFCLLQSDYIFFYIFILSLPHSSLFIPLYYLSLPFTVFVIFNIVYSPISHTLHVSTSACSHLTNHIVVFNSNRPDISVLHCQSIHFFLSQK